MNRLFVCLCLAFWSVCTAFAQDPVIVKLDSPYLFTDDKAVIILPGQEPEVSYSIKTITQDGWGPTATQTAPVTDGKVTVSPLAVGLHIVTFALTPPVEARFLAIAPPQPLQKDRVLSVLKRNGEKLFSGEPFVFLAMGDSVTATGDYDKMLVMLLKRATGNPNITSIKKAFAGYMVDSAVWSFDKSLTPKPDLGLLMYGLNDQGGGEPLDSFLGQCQWVAERVTQDYQADMMFLLSTPDISAAQPPAEIIYSNYISRTVGYTAHLSALADQMGLPVVETLQALWGKGGANLNETGRGMWPRFPQRYNLPMTSMLETNGAGDGIHPNVLGHLALARAVYETIGGQQPPVPLAIFAVSEWTPAGAVSHITVKNVSGVRREGRIEAAPLKEGGACEMKASGEYSLAPDGELRFDAAWTQATSPETLTKYPSITYLASNRAIIPLIDYANGGSRIYPVPAPFPVYASFERERLVVHGNEVTVKLRQGSKVATRTVAIPAGSEVGRIPLLEKVGATWAATELAYVRYGAAKRGEAVVDGNLDEWADNTTWSSIGEPCQMRIGDSDTDPRIKEEGCYLRLAFKAGENGIYMAIKGTGKLDNDRYFINLDSRPAEQIGTFGRYYWVRGNVAPDGKVTMNKGNTSKNAPGMKATWQPTEDGANFEFFFPYELVETTAWPESGDLGFMLWWHHRLPDGKTTISMEWSDFRHIANPRWMNVVRLDEGDGKPLPYMVRVK